MASPVAHRLISRILPSLVLALLLQQSLAYGQSQSLIDFASPAAEQRIKPNGKQGVTFKIVDGKAGKDLEVQCAVAANGSPGVAIRPEGATWDLSAYGAVEVELTNLGTDPLNAFVRVDNPGDWKGSPWDQDRAAIQPGKTGIVKVTFGYTWGAKGYALDASKVSQVLIFSNKVKKDTAFRISAVRATGKPGDKPAGMIEQIKPADGVLLSPEKAVSESAVQVNGATTSLVDAGGRKVTRIAFVSENKNKPSGVTFKPLPGTVWNLTQFTQVEFSLANPGKQPVHVICRVDNPNANNQKDSAVAEATVPAGAKQTVSVSFFAPRPWDGEDKTSRRQFTSDRIVGITLATDAAGVGQAIDLAGVRATVGAPDSLPDWIGKRPPVPGNWTMTFDDEFDGKTVNEKNWELPKDVTASIWDSQAVNVAANAFVEQGYLKIRCEKLTGPKPTDPKLKDRKYATCVITTFDKFAQKYGYFEARMKLPQTMGMWPAFWMMPDRGKDAGVWWQRQDTKNGGMEFDIMEHLVRFGPYRYNIAMHWDGYGKEHKATGSDVYFMPDKDGFVTSGLLWEPGKLTYYCNGKVVGSWTNERISALPGYILLTMPVGGWGTGGYVDEAGLPAYFTVDYVRAWQKDQWAAPAGR